MTWQCTQAFVVLYFLLLSRNFILGNVLHPPFDALDNNPDNEIRKGEYSLADYDDKLLPNCTDYATVEEYFILENGSLALPGSKQIFDSYFLRNHTAYLCGYQFPELVTQPAYNFSDEFLSCGHILIDPEEFHLLKNGSIYIEIYSKTYGPMDFYLQEQGVYICLPSFETLQHNHSIPIERRKFSNESDYVTFAGLLISIVSLLSHLVMFCLVSAVRNLPGYCLASLSLSLLLAYTCFLVAFLLEIEYFCAALGMCVYYFFLTSFFWMNAIAFDFWRSFRGVMRKLRISSQRVPWKRFGLYSFYSWGSPALLTVLVKVFDSTDLLPEEFRPSFGHRFCWFGQRKALMVFFAIPLIVIMLLNILFFVDVVYVISLATFKAGRQVHDTRLKKRFIMFTRLALIMGLTWVFGIAAGFADNMILWYIFIIFNTLQGLFIFAVFMASSKVRNLCFNKYQNRGKRFSTSIRTISAAL